MATVTLDRMWIKNLISGASVSAFTDPNRDQSWAVAGSIRTYAGGRQRGVSTAGLSGQWSITLVELPLTTVTLLQTWLKTGVTVLLRDHRGQSFYGTFFAVAVSEVVGLGSTAVYTAKIDFLRVDVTEGV